MLRPVIAGEYGPVANLGRYQDLRTHRYKLGVKNPYQTP
jgi:hypothetical protein